MTGSHPTRRAVLAGLVTLPANAALSGSSDGAHLLFADKARRLASQGGAPLRILIPVGSEANIASVTAHFSDLTGVPVSVETAGVREVAARLLIAHASGERAFDIAVPATYDIPDLVAADVLLPLYEDALPDLSHGKALYSEGDSFDGAVYGYQTDGDAYIVFMNRDFLEDATLRRRYEDAHGAEFGPPATWEELDQQVAFVTREVEGAFGALMPRAPGYLEWEFWLRFHAEGVWPLSPEFEPQFDGDEGVAVLEDMISLSPFLARDYGGQTGLFRNWNAFHSNRIYLTFGWGGTQKTLGSRGRPLAGRLVHAPIPGGRGTDKPAALPYFNWGWTYAVLRDSPVPELAAAFARFAVSPVVSTDAVRQADGFFDPFLEEHYTDTGVREIYGDAFLDVHRASLTSAIPDFYIADRSAYFSTLGSWLRLALDGVVTPPEALRRVADHWRLLADQGERESQARRWRQLRAKYPRAIARHLRDLHG